MEKDLKLYLVSEGDVTPADYDTEWDGERSVLVMASSEKDALEIAAAYDAGDIGVDNAIYEGRTIAVVMRRE